MLVNKINFIDVDFISEIHENNLLWDLSRSG